LIDPAVHLEREILERHTPKVSAGPPECQSLVRGSAIVARARVLDSGQPDPRGHAGRRRRAC
jgi:hypothetical protein